MLAVGNGKLVQNEPKKVNENEKKNSEQKWAAVNQVVGCRRKLALLTALFGLECKETIETVSLEHKKRTNKLIANAFSAKIFTCNINCTAHFYGQFHFTFFSQWLYVLHLSVMGSCSCDYGLVFTFANEQLGWSRIQTIVWGLYLIDSRQIIARIHIEPIFNHGNMNFSTCFSWIMFTFACNYCVLHQFY